MSRAGINEYYGWSQLMISKLTATFFLLSFPPRQNFKTSATVAKFKRLLHVDLNVETLGNKPDPMEFMMTLPEASQNGYIGDNFWTTGAVGVVIKARRRKSDEMVLQGREKIGNTFGSSILKQFSLVHISRIYNTMRIVIGWQDWMDTNWWSLKFMFQHH